MQDNVVARVLLEHVGGAFHQSDPRRAVNYLDLSRLGEEGETPASDEIWLSVAGGGEDDKVFTVIVPKSYIVLQRTYFFSLVKRCTFWNGHHKMVLFI